MMKNEWFLIDWQANSLRIFFRTPKNAKMSEKEKLSVAQMVMTSIGI